MKLDAKKRKAEIERIAERVLGFFAGKGLLIVPWVKPLTNIKITVREVLLTAEHVEPRALEVLPAAIIRFPRSVLHVEELPKELAGIVAAIKRGDTEHEGYLWVKYKDMRDWANLKLPDRRSKPVAIRRKMKSFRFSPDAIRALQKAAGKAGVDETTYIEGLLLTSKVGRSVGSH